MARTALLSLDTAALLPISALAQRAVRPCRLRGAPGVARATLDRAIGFIRIADREYGRAQRGSVHVM